MNTVYLGEESEVGINKIPAQVLENGKFLRFLVRFTTVFSCGVLPGFVQSAKRWFMAIVWFDFLVSSPNAQLRVG